MSKKPKLSPMLLDALRYEKAAALLREADALLNAPTEAETPPVVAATSALTVFPENPPAPRKQGRPRRADSPPVSVCAGGAGDKKKRTGKAGLAIAAEIRRNPNQLDNEIAETVGCSPSHVSK